VVNAELVREVEALPADERLDLLGRIWDSLDPEPARHELIEARLGLANHQAAPGSAVAWDTFVTSLRQRHL